MSGCCNIVWAQNNGKNNSPDVENAICKTGCTLCVMLDLYAWCTWLMNKMKHRELSTNISIYTICDLFFPVCKFVATF